MKLKEKLAEQYADLNRCCCGNSGCGGKAQVEAYVAGFEAAKIIIIDKYTSRDYYYITNSFPVGKIGNEEINET